jgi:hypothetical protein
VSLVPFKPSRGRPRKVIIPESFQVLGHKVRVYLKSPDEMTELAKQELVYDPKTPHTLGLYDHKTHTIYLSTALPIDSSELMQCYLHEKMHCLLESSGNPELSEDENFVDLMAELEYQSLMSKHGRLN